jgi:uncharacterized protein
MSCPQQTPISPFHIMAKPVGASCNLDCKYCFYLEKEQLYVPQQSRRMQPEVLEVFIKGFIDAHSAPEVTFAWQGGEPTLYGLKTFETIVALQRKYAGGKKIHNALQTNGTLLTNEWGEFLARENFLVGISIDGPPKYHDTYRVNRRGQPTFAAVLKGLHILKAYKVEFNTLTVVNRLNSEHPEEVYKFLRRHGSGHMQFIPLVERLPQEGAHHCGLKLAGPPHPEDEGRPLVTEWSVRPKAFGNFLAKIFDIWAKEDVGKVFIQTFEGTLGSMLNRGGGFCVTSPECGQALALEHNGDVYACDHFVYPEFNRGNIMEKSFAEMVRSPEQLAFGRAKSESLPGQCRECPFLKLCYGGCPKHRFLKTADGEPGLNYLCRGYQHYFATAVPTLKKIAWQMGLS